MKSLTSPDATTPEPEWKAPPVGVSGRSLFVPICHGSFMSCREKPANAAGKCEHIDVPFPISGKPIANFHEHDAPDTCSPR
jgi:hypothetical protein